MTEENRGRERSVRRGRKRTIDDVLNDVAARQAALGVIIDEEEVADEADRAVAKVREEDAKRGKQ